jgi:5-hydroxyisourate hydrolase-like protein (transthyretin family)
MRRFTIAAGVLLGLAALAPAAEAVEIVGRVMNATTGKPAGDVSVNLLALRGQMVPVRDTVTDAEGNFRFVVAANPSERFMVQVPYRGVNYNKPAMLSEGDTITVFVEVYELGASAADIKVETHSILLQPQRGHLRVDEFYTVRNASNPPQTFNPDEGSFRFRLPPTIGDLQVSAQRTGGMPLRQSPQPAGEENSFVLQFPFYPGESDVQISYVLPAAAGETLEVRLPVSVAAGRRHVAVPRTGVEVVSQQLKEVTQEQVPQARIYTTEVKPPAELALTLKINPAALEAAARAAESAAAAAEAPQSTVTIVPHPTNRAQWYIVGLTLLVLLIGLYYLYSFAPAGASAQAPHTPDARASQPGRT